VSLPRITAAVGVFDRTQPLLDGRVAVQGYDVAWTSGELESLFSRAFATAEFDVTELSFCNYLIAAARGDSPYVALPIFPTRCFRHHAFFIRTDRGIRGAKVLQHYYGVNLQRIRWVVGDIDIRERAAADIKVPAIAGVDIVREGNRLLGDMLAAGELDGLIAYSPPRCLGAPGIGRLFERWWEDEQRYFRDTGIFPIMHVVAVRRSLLEAHPTLGAALYRAFCLARDSAVRDLEIEQAPKTMLPWSPAHLQETRRQLGENFWPYGVAANRVTVEAQVRWACEQGLIAEPVALDRLFAALDRNPGT
jgi:4,5-dihydroxyphthalate decarboxylase